MSKQPRDQCIEWAGYTSSNGYGSIAIGNTTVGVHRVSWALANGRMPKKGMDICHSCDNRKCINPNHLFEGTRQDNMVDAREKGRLVIHNKGKKECGRGHLFTEDNILRKSDGRRSCRKCIKMLRVKYKEQALQKINAERKKG